MSTPETTIQLDPLRPTYHFLPPANWMNDPNGPLYYAGWYHLFYQYNPFSDEWGHIHWGHARSRNLVNWEHLPIALTPSTELGEEDVFSGCAGLNGAGEPLLFYTSVKQGSRAQRPPNEQWAARPLDADLLTWEKHPANPILALPTHGGPPFEGDWRDPFIFVEDGRTFMVVAGSWENTAGVALYEASADSLLRWRYCGLLHHSPRDEVRLFECPNFVKLGSQWLLLSSPFRPIEYLSGDFDLATLTFTPRQQGVLDAGMSDAPNYYASNIVFAPDGRCILLGWVRGFPKGRGWNGALALPRVLTLGVDGHPRQEPIAELQQLRGALIELQTGAADAQEVEHTFVTDSLEIQGRFQVGEAGVVELHLSGQPLLHYGAGKLTVAGTTVDLPLAADGRLTVQLFLDRSVVELFANNGQVAITRLIAAPGAPCTASLSVQGQTVVIERLTAWELNLAPPDSLAA